MTMPTEDEIRKAYADLARSLHRDLIDERERAREAAARIQKHLDDWPPAEGSEDEIALYETLAILKDAWTSSRRANQLHRELHERPMNMATEKQYEHVISELQDAEDTLIELCGELFRALPSFRQDHATWDGLTRHERLDYATTFAVDYARGL